MLKRLAHRLQQRHWLAILLLGVFLALVLLFTFWLLFALFGAVQFRDNLIETDYEGSLSKDLGLLVALTSEAASRIEDEPDARTQHAVGDLKSQLDRVQMHLAALRPPAIRPLRSGTAAQRSFRLDDADDEAALLRLMNDPRLNWLSLGELGLDVLPSAGMPHYPHLESTESPHPATSFVFVPASGVDSRGDQPDVFPRLRRELVLSKIAERELRTVLSQPGDLSITRAYYIGCSDFVRLVFKQPEALAHYRQTFRAVRSFSDRTYFHGSMEAPGKVRESALYLDVTGRGFVRTYSVFFTNESLGVCGMLAVDVTLQPLEGFWQRVGLGLWSRRLRDFTFGTYDVASKETRFRGRVSADLRKELKEQLATARPGALGSGILDWPVAGAKVFTVPIGEQRIGLFVFDAKAARLKYYAIIGLGAMAIVCFVSIVALTAGGYLAARQAEAEQIEILDKLHAGFVTVDRRGAITLANEPFRRMVGAIQSGATIQSYLQPESAADYRRLTEARGAEFEFAGSMTSAAGAAEPVIIASSPLAAATEGESRMLILIPSRELEQAIARKFLNVFSHALKSPVHSILLLADLFRRRNAMPRFEEYFSLLLRKVEEFRTLTDNVLRFSALDVKAIEVDWKSVNVARVLRSVLGAARERARARGLELRENISDSLKAPADAELLKVVFNNLIDNAIKYTAHGYVSVSTSDRIDHIEAVVEDSGPGVPAADREQIFTLFVQGTAARRSSHEGLGLGLYISRLYMEAMGGALRYEPVYREGAAHDDQGMAGSRLVVVLPKKAGRFENAED